MQRCHAAARKPSHIVPNEQRESRHAIQIALGVIPAVLLKRGTGVRNQVAVHQVEVAVGRGSENILLPLDEQ